MSRAQTAAGKTRRGTPKIRPLRIIQAEENGLEINKKDELEKQVRKNQQCVQAEDKKRGKDVSKSILKAVGLGKMALPLTVKDNPENVRITAQWRLRVQ